MKYLREASDIHLDFDISRFGQTHLYDPGAPKPECDMDMLWYPEPMEGDDETCMIIPGDFWVSRKILTRKHPHTNRSWLEMLSDRFKYVVGVLGNHDCWQDNISFINRKINEDLVSLGLDKKVFILENNSVVLDDVKFVGGTLWTDFDRANPMILLKAPNIMNDYNYMRVDVDYRKAKPKDLLHRHRTTRDYIFDNAKRDHPDQKVVVLSHHAPSKISVGPQYQHHGDSNFYYFTDLEAKIDTSEIDLWFHGHCHHVSDYNIGNTRVICNPRGYINYENTSWNPQLRISL